MDCIKIITPESWKDYELIDTGDGENWNDLELIFSGDRNHRQYGKNLCPKKSGKKHTRIFAVKRVSKKKQRRANGF